MALSHQTYVEKDRCSCGREVVTAEFAVDLETNERSFFSDYRNEEVICRLCAKKKYGDERRGNMTA